jgi:hypothetical protein
MPRSKHTLTGLFAHIMRPVASAYRAETGRDLDAGAVVRAAKRTVRGWVAHLLRRAAGWLDREEPTACRTTSFSSRTTREEPTPAALAAPVATEAPAPPPAPEPAPVFVPAEIPAAPEPVPVAPVLVPPVEPVALALIEDKPAPTRKRAKPRAKVMAAAPRVTAKRKPAARDRKPVAGRTGAKAPEPTREAPKGTGAKRKPRKAKAAA